MGWGTAAQTFAGQNLGAERPIRAIKSGWITMAYDAATNVLLIALVFAYGEAILRVFDDEAGPVAIALQYLHVVAPSYVALGGGIVLGNAMAAAGATRTTFAIDAAVILVLQIPICTMAALLGHGSVRSLFQCVALTNVVSAIVYCVIYARGTWLGAVARTRS